MRAPRSAAALTALLLGLSGSGALSACGSGTGTAPLAGVDGLEVPTPSPDPDDFVAEVDNPWLPLVVGSSAVYEPGTGVLGADVAQLLVSVEEGPQVAGVATTAVRRTTTGSEGTVPPDPEAGGETVDYYAQDAAGNVWWFGREGEWLAGEDGAEAGVAMLATPRVGDGYREALAAGIDVRAQVLSLDEEATTPAGTFGGLVLVEVRDTAADRVERRAYAEGLGLVAVETVSGTPDVRLGLVQVDEPQSGS
ncbi:hypothetical protein [Nocardioides nanhaiensis]|uniref:Lipoprotein n=1 Tax=Nocardioides nanhaiensis TaxID=1476871 RepID=A0ABP8W146_9ACTN